MSISTDAGPAWTTNLEVTEKTVTDQEVVTMTVARHHQSASQHDTASVVTGATEVTEHPTGLRRALAALRIAFGVTFLWAFLDKTFALGFHTGYDQDGVLDRFGDGRLDQRRQPDRGLPELRRPRGQPVQGVLQRAGRPRRRRLALHARPARHRRHAPVGVAMRLGTAAGALMYAFMYAASLPLENNPVVDDHLVGVIVMVVLALERRGTTWGLGRPWRRIALVQRYPVLG